MVTLKFISQRNPVPSIRAVMVLELRCVFLFGCNDFHLINTHAYRSGIIYLLISFLFVFFVLFSSKFLLYIMPVELNCQSLSKVRDKNTLCILFVKILEQIAIIED